MKANECPQCGGALDKTTDAEHYAWHVTYDVCNRCESVAYHRAVKDGVARTDAEKQAAASGRLWRAAEAEPAKH